MGEIRSFFSRYSKRYRKELIAELKKYYIYGKNLSEAELTELKKDLLSIELNDKNYSKNVNGFEFTHCLRISFCGTSASTLLNTSINSDDEYKSLNKEIHEAFKNLISKENCKELNSHKIYLKIRFLFSYLYSEMAFSLMKAEFSRKHSGYNEKTKQKLIYNFEVESGLLKEHFDNSLITNIQIQSLRIIDLLLKSNPHLGNTLDSLVVNTLKFRFTPIPITFCLLIVNHISYGDPYIYAKADEETRSLSTHYPLTEVRLKEDKDHYNSIENHFDYMWHHDLTLEPEDCTKKGNEFRKMLLPHEVQWNAKKKLIRSYLANKTDNFMPDLEKEGYWENNLRDRFLKSSKFPFDYQRVEKGVHDNVTVLYTDFADFTDLCSRGTAIPLVEELNLCFSAFDTIISHYHLEKIKTVGDAYICVAGLSKPDRNDALSAIYAAFDMRDFILEREKERGDRLHFKMRIGLHTGTVVAGVIGIIKPELDIWGDTVNTAARMQQHGEVGKINISEKTQVEISKNSNKFYFEKRKKIKVKGKEKIQMFFIEKH